MKIGIDAMGGDLAPAEAVKGVYEFLASEDGAEVVLIGDEAAVQPLMTATRSGNVSVVHAPEVIEMHEHPTKALREKRRSSIAVGFALLAEGKLDAFISAGNTGAMLVGAVYSLKSLEGVLRPTISTIIPKENGGTGLLLDVGLNADCKPEQLAQFGVMGSVYAQSILGIKNPRVGLLNIGEEEGKGNTLAQAAYPLLKQKTAINFIGNVEGRDVFVDKADVIVCDGFTGNVILKLAESLYGVTRRQGAESQYFNRFNFEDYGGTPVLGVAKPVIIGHGISKAKAFANMLRLAKKMIESGVMQKLQRGLDA